jgi:hypothetical protein
MFGPTPIHIHTTPENGCLQGAAAVPASSFAHSGSTLGPKGLEVTR